MIVLYVFYLFQSLELFHGQATVKFFIIYNIFFSHAWIGWQRIVVCKNKRKIQKDDQVNKQALHEPIQDHEQALHEPIQDHEQALHDPIKILNRHVMNLSKIMIVSISSQTAPGKFQ